MSALGMDANGVVRSAYEFKDIFERTGVAHVPYCCPFCEVPYIDKCISTTCKKAPHFSLPKDTTHRNGCDGEGESPESSKIAPPGTDEPKRTVVGDVDFPEALVAARRERGRLKRHLDGSIPSPQEVVERRKRVDAADLIASKYTSSLLRTFVVAYRNLRKLAGTSASAEAEQGSPTYKAIYREVMSSRRLELYGVPFNYGSAFFNSNLTPAATPRIYYGKGTVRRIGDELVIADTELWPRAYKSAERLQFFIVANAAPPAESPQTHMQLIAELEEAAASGNAVHWNAYGLTQLTEDDEFVLRLETLDHLYLG